MIMQAVVCGKGRQVTGFALSLSTGLIRTLIVMGYEITLIADSTEQLDADGYALEGPLTTFFRNQPGRAARLDPWSTRILSVRTERIACIRSREASMLPGLSLVG